MQYKIGHCHMRIGLRGVFGNAHLKTSMKRKPMGYGR